MQLNTKKGVKIYRDFYIDMEILPPFIPKIAKIPIAFDNETVDFKKIIGDNIEKFEIIAVLKNNIPVYSPFDGILKDIVTVSNIGKFNNVQYAVIETSEQNKPNRPLWKTDFEINFKNLLYSVKNAAVVEEISGEYLFDLLVENQNYNTLIINAVDEQPFDLSKTATLSEFENEIINGSKIFAKGLNIKNIKLLIMKNFRTQYVFKKGLSDFEIVKVKGKYPYYGAVNKFSEKLNGLVIGPQCARAVYRAFMFGEPQLTQVVTVWGDGVKKPANIEIYTGTVINELLENRGAFGVLERIVAGGVMTGYTASATNSLLKNDGSLTVMPFKKHHKKIECINCGRCANVCPENLAPYYILKNSGRAGEKMAKKLTVERCISCGNCSYICPSRIPLNGIISEHRKYKLKESK